MVVGGEDEDAPQGTDGHAAGGTVTMPFKVEPAHEGRRDGFDDLPQRLGQLRSRPPDLAPRTCRGNRASGVKPGVTCAIAGVTGFAPLSRGAMLPVGRHGAHCGESFGNSSVFTWSAMAREPDSAFTH